MHCCSHPMLTVLEVPLLLAQVVLELLQLFSLLFEALAFILQITFDAHQRKQSIQKLL
eukprot:m.174300 g.174300  ORF g.174300 m.174300 type:complete len:58 (-) comp15318_c0_seq4:328-501(-)